GVSAELCSAKIIGVFGCFILNVFTALVINESNCASERDLVIAKFGIQSSIKASASSAFIKSSNGCSKRPLPEKPRFIISLGNDLPKIFVHAKPGRVAHAPCAIEVPSTTIGLLCVFINLKSLFSATPISSQSTVL